MQPSEAMTVPVEDVASPVGFTLDPEEVSAHLRLAIHQLGQSCTSSRHLRQDLQDFQDEWDKILPILKIL